MCNSGQCRSVRPFSTSARWTHDIGVRRLSRSSTGRSWLPSSDPRPSLDNHEFLSLPIDIREHLLPAASTLAVENAANNFYEYAVRVLAAEGASPKRRATREGGFSELRAS